MFAMLDLIKLKRYINNKYDTKLSTAKVSIEILKYIYKKKFFTSMILVLELSGLFAAFKMGYTKLSVFYFCLERVTDNKIQMT